MGAEWEYCNDKTLTILCDFLTLPVLDVKTACIFHTPICKNAISTSIIGSKMINYNIDQI